MTQFETELINAIRHGCPFCKGRRNDSMLHVIKARIVTCWPTLGNNDEVCWGRQDEEIMLRTEYLDVECSVQHRNGKNVLWTAENGWIPELQEIVKGE